MLIRALVFIFYPLQRALALGASFFPTLLDVAFPPRSSERIVRSLTPERLCARMKPIPILLNHTYIGTGGANECVALFPYRLPEVEACIIEAKFHGSTRAAELLEYCLQKYIDRATNSKEQGVREMVLLPIPLSATRLRERGYCQTERIAKAGVSSTCAIDTTLLKRTRHTIPQTKLSGRERRKNLQGAFAATKPCDPQRTYIVLDDVVTTGSTISAAAEALRVAGATRILPIAMAHADLLR